tara:strand:- start:1769 stop:2287 length:519 start_codon:yes stop_codon:yes gene_type:complete
MTNMNKALFLDRDGVINYDFGYVYEIDKFIFRNEIFKICQVAQNKGYMIFVITNQAGIGRGKFSESDFNYINEYMISEFNSKGIKIQKTFYCPYHPLYGKGKYLKSSYDRKPNPGMLLKAIKEFNINVHQSIMIGDKETDHIASIRSGIDFYVDASKPNWVSKFLEILFELF